LKSAETSGLADRNDILSAEKLRNAFKGGTIGREIIFFESVDSTNDAAMEIGAQREDPEGVVVIADAQKSGRGRLGRSWISPPGGNLYFTLLLRPSFPPREAPLLTLMAAVAIVSAIREHTGLKAVIKWPNDILAGDKKTGGILMEMRSDANRINLLALGIGVNVNLFPEMLPEGVRELTTTLKQEAGRSIDRVKLFEEMLSCLEHWYKILLNGDKKVLFNEWLSLDSTIGREVKVERSGLSGEDKIISGIAEGISDDGQLLIRLSSGKIEKVSAGDVTILKSS
jgi:BirA family transcriptional regulator, biotin operon repressor / biotin---[acetyl-CoA-carboxylase] ligase